MSPNRSETVSPPSRYTKTLRFVVVFPTVAVVYFLLGTLTLGWNGDGNGVSPAFLPAGFGFVVTLLLGRRYCLSVFAGAAALGRANASKSGLSQIDPCTNFGCV